MIFFLIFKNYFLNIKTSKQPRNNSKVINFNKINIFFKTPFKI